jgi:hypothetical protein
LWNIVIFVESDDYDDLPAAQRILTGSLPFRARVKAAGHGFLGVYDIDALVDRRLRCIPGGGCRWEAVSIPDEWKPWFDAVRGDPTPRLAISDKAGGGPVLDYPLPANEQDFFLLLEAPP